jgi:hypothetical protein
VAKYRYLVSDVWGNVREEIPFADVSYTPQLNGAGSFQGSLPVDHEKATRAALEPMASAVWVERERTLVWGGIVAGVNAEATVSVTAAGFWTYFTARHIRHRKEYVDTDQLTIVADLISYAQTQPGGSIGLQLSMPGAGSGVLRSRLYESWERKAVAEAVEELASLDNGFDFSIEPFYGADGRPNKVLLLSYPRRGQRREITLDLAKNLIGMPRWTIDGARIANLVDATGLGDAETMLIATAETHDRGAYPVLEQVNSYRDEGEFSNLIDRAVADVKRLQVPVEHLACDVRPDSEIKPGAFTLGDTLRCRARRGFIQIDGEFRVTSYTINVDDEHNEKLSINLQSEASVA